MGAPKVAQSSGAVGAKLPSFLARLTLHMSFECVQLDCLRHCTSSQHSQHLRNSVGPHRPPDTGYFPHWQHRSARSRRCIAKSTRAPKASLMAFEACLMNPSLPYCEYFCPYHCLCSEASSHIFAHKSCCSAFSQIPIRSVRRQSYQGHVAACFFKQLCWIKELGPIFGVRVGCSFQGNVHS